MSGQKDVATELAANLAPIKAVVFDLPAEEQEKIRATKAAVMLAAGPGINGFLATILALEALVKDLDATPNAPKEFQ